jgi:hypothetical protein
MSWTSFAELDGVTVGTSELSIISGTTSLATDTNKGVYQLWLDPVGAGMAKGDEFLVRIYEKVEETGGTKRLIFSASIKDAQTQPWIFPPLPLGFGWDMTITKLAGTDRAWDAEIRKLGAWTQHSELDGVTVGSSELSIISGTTSLSTDTTKGYIWVLVDLFAMAKADYFDISLYEKVEATGGTKRKFFTQRVANAPSENLITPGFMLGNGWDATLQKFAGTDRAFDASIRVAA